MPEFGIIIIRFVYFDLYDADICCTVRFFFFYKYSLLGLLLHTAIKAVRTNFTAQSYLKCSEYLCIVLSYARMR